MKEHTRSDNNPKYSVIIPVFNEEGNIEILHTRLTKVMESLGNGYEIIFVDDGSTDSSFQILKEINQRDKKVKAIRFTRNFGQHPAIMAGFEFARGKAIITIDVDLQNPPEEIPKLIGKLEEGYEVVYGIPKKRRDSGFRKACSDFTKTVLSRLLPMGQTDFSGFRALDVNVVNQLKQINEKSKFLDGLLYWMGVNIGTVEVDHNQRFMGKTKYSLYKLINVWFDMVTPLTEFPLKIATLGGIILGIIGLLMALFYLIRYFLYGFNVPGFATIVILITVFSGVQLLCLGILGEYIGRINSEVKNKPAYVIREIIGQEYLLYGQ